jgi:hypothetical protein
VDLVAPIGRQVDVPSVVLDEETNRSFFDSHRSPMMSPPRRVWLTELVPVSNAT